VREHSAGSTLTEIIMLLGSIAMYILHAMSGNNTKSLSVH